MDQSPLVGDQIRYGYEFAQKFLADGNALATAFWSRSADEEFWYLYLVTPLVDDLGPAATYRAVDTSLQHLHKTPWVRMDVKVISPTSPMAKVVAEVSPGAGLGKGYRASEDLYVYLKSGFDTPSVLPMTREEVSREILQLMSRGPGSVQPSLVNLKDGTHFNGLPFSIELGTAMAVVARFVVEQEPVPRMVPLDEIASIAS